MNSQWEPGGANQANDKRQESSDVTKTENTKGLLCYSYIFFFLGNLSVCLCCSQYECAPLNEGASLW